MKLTPDTTLAEMWDNATSGGRMDDLDRNIFMCGAAALLSVIKTTSSGSELLLTLDRLEEEIREVIAREVIG